jgi:hypothetical protein
LPAIVLLSTALDTAEAALEVVLDAVGLMMLMVVP